MLMDPTKDNLATKQALALADQEWGQQSLEKHLAGLVKTTEDTIVRQWFVLQCEPQREKTAASHLIGRRFKVFLPTEAKKQTRRGRKIVVIKPLFPGYLFARLNFQGDQSRLRFIHNAPGIRGGIHTFLMHDGRPAVIRDVVMEAVQKVAEQTAKPQKPASSFRVNQGVIVDDGPFSGFPAMITQIMRLEPNERIRALVNIFGRETPVEFDADQLRSL